VPEVLAFGVPYLELSLFYLFDTSMLRHFSMTQNLYEFLRKMNPKYDDST
jgi:hypothetical protein